ncbi:MAG: polysaccharide deacetylase family protein [Saccharofermentanales bacterium]|jgi:delta-lactam-biosynthetic de-N-acetylase
MLKNKIIIFLLIVNMFLCVACQDQSNGEDAHQEDSVDHASEQEEAKVTFAEDESTGDSKNQESKQEEIIKTFDEGENTKDSENQESKQEETIKTSEEESSKYSEKQEINISAYYLNIGDKISVKNSFPVYETSDNARDDNLQSSTYEQGVYYVFKKTNDAINLSRYADSPGGWTRYSCLEEYELLSEEGTPDQVLIPGQAPTPDQEFTPDQEPTSAPDTGTSETSTSDTGASDLNQSLSWSWGYPDQSPYMQEYSAIYKLDVSEKIIYLTFDNGYEYQNLTSQILDILKANNVKAAFFTTSSYLSNNPALAKRMLAEGHNLSNHTADHLAQGQSSASEIKEDILGWEDTYRNVLGVEPETSLMRPPEGSYSAESLKIAHELGYKTTFWNYGYSDWDTNNQPDPEDSLRKLLEHNEPGSIVLLHSISQTNVDILDQYIKSTISQGYRFELLK